MVGHRSSRFASVLGAERVLTARVAQTPPRLDRNATRGIPDIASRKEISIVIRPRGVAQVGRFGLPGWLRHTRLPLWKGRLKASRSFAVLARPLVSKADPPCFKVGRKATRGCGFSIEAEQVSSGKSDLPRAIPDCQNVGMNRRRIFDQELFAHFVTFSCYRRRRLLDHAHPKRILLGILNEQLSKLAATCVGFVIMPEHVHAVIWFPETGKLSWFMQEWKRVSSRNIRDWYRQQPAAYGFGQAIGEGFWQRRYYAFEIDNEQKLREKVEYMHLNPVRAGLVKRTVDWKWSSARHYELGRSVGVPVRWVL